MAFSRRSGPVGASLAYVCDMNSVFRDGFRMIRYTNLLT